ncbi:hypothetical protein [Cellulosilyticum ruminicola]|uniref:hypothetical protein n=1 Tax=Cellulosilyticum ruminicola TaxID=425254 RepID=UPI0006CF2B00|nr:hypothetical protein [Cellulosilyticum ruminicola]
MNKLKWGSCAIVLGGLALSFQIYGLELMQIIGKVPIDSWKYMKDRTIQFTILINVLIIVYGIWLVTDAKKNI